MQDTDDPEGHAKVGVARVVKQFGVEQGLGPVVEIAMVTVLAEFIRRDDHAQVKQPHIRGIVKLAGARLKRKHLVHVGPKDDLQRPMEQKEATKLSRQWGAGGAEGDH